MGACDSCKKDFPDCPMSFSGDCVELAWNISGLRTVLSVYDDVPYSQAVQTVDGAEKFKVPIDAMLINPNNWTLSTPCGVKYAMDHIQAIKSIVDEPMTAEQRALPGKWWKASELKPSLTHEGMIGIEVSGFKNDKNQVYLVNVVVRDASPLTQGSQTSNSIAAYNVATMQASEPVYQEPKIEGTNLLVMIAVGASLGGCLVIFIAIAVYLRFKRKKRVQQRIRAKLDVSS